MPSAASIVCQSTDIARNLPRPDGFIESTLRSYRATLSGGQPNEPKEFMKGLLNEVEKIIKFRIINPLLADIRPELFKKSQTQVLNVKWLGQNDKAFSKLDTSMASMDVVKWVEG